MLGLAIYLIVVLAQTLAAIRATQWPDGTLGQPPRRATLTARARTVVE